MDGSTCASVNCWAACGSFLTDGASGGRKTPSPTAFRFMARVPSCLPGGLADAIRGLMNAGVWNRCKYLADVEKLDLRAMLMRRNGALVMLETDFEHWPERTVCQPDYNDRENAYHSIVVVCGEGTKQHRGKVRVMNPLCKTLRWVPVESVIEAALIYNREHHERPGELDCLVVLPPMA
jgi:hypothetical protein